MRKMVASFVFSNVKVKNNPRTSDGFSKNAKGQLGVISAAATLRNKILFYKVDLVECFTSGWVIHFLCGQVLYFLVDDWWVIQTNWLSCNFFRESYIFVWTLQKVQCLISVGLNSVQWKHSNQKMSYCKTSVHLKC